MCVCVCVGGGGGGVSKCMCDSECCMGVLVGMHVCSQCFLMTSGFYTPTYTINT